MNDNTERQNGCTQIVRGADCTLPPVPARLYADAQKRLSQRDLAYQVQALHDRHGSLRAAVRACGLDDRHTATFSCIMRGEPVGAEREREVRRALGLARTKTIDAMPARELAALLRRARGCPDRAGRG